MQSSTFFAVTVLVWSAQASKGLLAVLRRVAVSVNIYVLWSCNDAIRVVTVVSRKLVLRTSGWGLQGSKKSRHGHLEVDVEQTLPFPRSKFRLGQHPCFVVWMAALQRYWICKFSRSLVILTVIEALYMLHHALRLSRRAWHSLKLSKLPTRVVPARQYTLANFRGEKLRKFLQVEQTFGPFHPDPSGTLIV